MTIEILINLADLQEAESFLSGLRKIIENQKDEISQLKNKNNQLHLDNKSMVNFM